MRRSLHKFTVLSSSEMNSELFHFISMEIPLMNIWKFWSENDMKTIEIFDWPTLIEDNIFGQIIPYRMQPTTCDDL